jgi:RNA polymerase-binding transcription factor DksA
VTPQEVATIEALLRVEHEQASASEKSLVAEYEGILDASVDANLDDEHDPEGATVGYERARVASLLGHARGRLSALAAAKDRIRTGAYGTCVQCGRAISFGRLMALPTAVTCVSCANSSTRMSLAATERRGTRTSLHLRVPRRRPRPRSA